MIRLLLAALCASLALSPIASFAQGSDDDAEESDETETTDEEVEEEADEEAAADDDEGELFYSDGISMAWEDSFDFSGIPEDTFIWSYRGEGNGLMAFAVDVINDTLPAEFDLHDWDITGGSDESGADDLPTDDEIRAKLEDEAYSPLRQVLADGPIEGEEVPLMVLVPDSALIEARQTQAIPNVAILKAVSMADQLTNGLKFNYAKRQDLVQFMPGAQSGVPQLQYQDAKVFEGVVQFHFQLGMPVTSYAGKRRGEGYSARADVPSASIADGYDSARNEALRLAVRRAIGDASRNSSAALPDTVTGTIDFWEITNEGYLDGIFTVELRAWITVDALNAAPATTNSGLPSNIIINGERQEN